MMKDPGQNDLFADGSNSDEQNSSGKRHEEFDFSLDPDDTGASDAHGLSMPSPRPEKDESTSTASTVKNTAAQRKTRRKIPPLKIEPDSEDSESDKPMQQPTANDHIPDAQKNLHALKEQAKKARRQESSTPQKEEYAVGAAAKKPAPETAKVENAQPAAKNAAIPHKTAIEAVEDLEQPLARARVTHTGIGTRPYLQAKNPSPPTSDIHNKPTGAKHFSFPDDASLGQILQEARSRMGLSTDQIAIETKIRKSYIESLEHDDFASLPSAVYIKAYARRLCREYGIDESIASKAITKSVKEKNKEAEKGQVPEDVLIELEKSKQVNVGKQKRLKGLRLAIGSICIVMLAAVLTLIYLLLSKGKAGEDQSSSQSSAAVAQPLSDDAIMPSDEIDRYLKKLLVAYPIGTMSELRPPQR